MIEHFWKLFEEIERIIRRVIIKVLKVIKKRAEDLLKRYGSALKHYQDKYFYKLFDFSVIISEKDYYTAEYDAVRNQEYELSQQDISKWVDQLRKFLQADRYYFYLEKDPEFEFSGITEISGTKEEPDKEMTEARRLLAKSLTRCSIF